MRSFVWPPRIALPGFPHKPTPLPESLPPIWRQPVPDRD